MPTIRIPLHSRKYPGLFAVIDEEDYELVSAYRWNVQPGRNTFYAVSIQRIDGHTRTIRMHRLVYGKTDLFIDHIDGDGLNNQRSNLRAVTNQTNVAFGQRRISRAKKGSRSQYLGVSWGQSKKRPWKAYIGSPGSKTPTYLGRFETEEEAARAYDAAAHARFGKSAPLNFPECSKNVEGVEPRRTPRSTPHHTENPNNDAKNSRMHSKCRSVEPLLGDLSSPKERSTVLQITCIHQKPP